MADSTESPAHTRLREELHKAFGGTESPCPYRDFDLVEHARRVAGAEQAGAERAEREIVAWLIAEDERLDGLWSVNDARRRILGGSWRQP